MDTGVGRCKWWCALLHVYFASIVVVAIAVAVSSSNYDCCCFWLALLFLLLPWCTTHIPLHSNSHSHTHTLVCNMNAGAFRCCCCWVVNFFDVKVFRNYVSPHQNFVKFPHTNMAIEQTQCRDLWSWGASGWPRGTTRQLQSIARSPASHHDHHHQHQHASPTEAGPLRLCVSVACVMRACMCVCPCKCQNMHKISEYENINIPTMSCNI